MYCRLPGFYIHGIFQARVLKWVAMPFSKMNFGDHKDHKHSSVRMFTHEEGKKEIKQFLLTKAFFRAMIFLI